MDETTVEIDARGMELDSVSLRLYDCAGQVMFCLGLYTSQRL